MASLLPSLATHSQYKDRHYHGTQQEYTAQMKSSTTLYLGNLSFYTSEEQIHAVLAKAGVVLGKSYPLPIVDHAAARQRALDGYAAMRA